MLPGGLHAPKSYWPSKKTNKHEESAEIAQLKPQQQISPEILISDSPWEYQETYLIMNCNGGGMTPSATSSSV